MPDKYFFGVAKPGRTDFGISSFESADMLNGLVEVAKVISNTPFHDGFVMCIASSEDIVRKRLAKHQRASRSDIAAQLSAKLAMLAPVSGSEACEAKDLPSAILPDKNPDATSDEIDAMIEAAIREAE